MVIQGVYQRLALMFVLVLLNPSIHAQNPIKFKKIYIKSSISYKFLREKGFKPRKDLLPWPISLPIEWNSDPFKDRNWRFQLHAWRIIDPILLRYQNTKNRKYLQEAVEIIKDWYQYHFVLEKESKYEWYDMATRIRAMKLDWLWNEIEFNKIDKGDELKLLFNNLMQQHASKLVELNSDFCSLEVINAQEEPLLGWVSFKYNKIEKTTVIRAYCSDNKEGNLDWPIKLL